jgi:hypothetical protein
MSNYPNTRSSSPRSPQREVRIVTHVPVLQLACDAVKPTHVIEHGMGIGSTPFFHGQPTVQRIFSFENDPVWRACSGCTNFAAAHRIEAYSDERLVQWLADVPADKCVVLVDGEALERPRVLKAAMAAGVAWIVEHDAECFDGAGLRLRRELSAEHGYVAVQYVAVHPETAAYVRASAVPEVLASADFVAL